VFYLINFFLNIPSFFSVTLKTEELTKIDNFITSYLHPYITGQINEKNENNHREPMIELLLKEFKVLDLSKKNKIEETALKIYFEKAAQGLYVNQSTYENRRDAKSIKIDEKDPRFNILIDALEKALPKDFLTKKLSHQVIVEKAKEAILKINVMRVKECEDRINERQKIKYEPKEIDRRRDILEKLNTAEKLWSIDL
jgi:hypothetical protein